MSQYLSQEFSNEFGSCAVVSDAAVGYRAGLEHGLAHPVAQPPVLRPEEGREQQDVPHPGDVAHQPG